MSVTGNKLDGQLPSFGGLSPQLTAYENRGGMFLVSSPILKRPSV